MTRLERNGFVAGALINIGGVLLFSRGFTNAALTAADPVVMSNFGLVMVMVWGLAYAAASRITAGVRWIAGVFAIEKLAYVIAWLMWHSANSLSAVFAQDLLAGIFFAIYGINDFLFMCFFAWVCWRHRAPVSAD